jgi:hypothetical protein
MLDKIFLILALLGLSKAISFRADFLQSDPTNTILLGQLSGRIDYNWLAAGANTQIRRDYNVLNPTGTLSGPIEIILYQTDD